MSAQTQNIFRKLVVPLLVTAASGVIFFFAGDSYKAFGLAALDSSRRVISYVLGVTLFISFGVLLDRAVRYLIFDALISKPLGTPVPGLLKQFSSIIIYLIVGGAILAVVFKQDLTVLWAASGVAGIVLGLALQTLLQDIYSGLALNIDRPLKIGDSIQIDMDGKNIKGEVKEISWRTTHILDKSNNVIILPNNKVAAATITNFSELSSHSVDFRDVTVDALIPHERVLRILMSAAIEASTTFATDKDPPPYVLVWEIAPNGIVYRVHYFCGLWQRDQAHSTILQCVLKNLRQVGLRPAAPRLEHSASEHCTWQSVFPSEKDVVYVLASSALLEGLDSECLTLLASKSKMRTIQVDQVIVHAGETGSSAFVLIEGLLTAAVRKRGSAAEPMVMLSPRDCFGGEVALLGDAHPATLRSRTSATVCELTTSAFHALFSFRSEAVTVLSQNLAKMATTTERARTATESDVDGIVSDIERSIKRNFASAIRKADHLGGARGRSVGAS